MHNDSANATPMLNDDVPTDQAPADAGDMFFKTRMVPEPANDSEPAAPITPPVPVWTWGLANVYGELPDVLLDRKVTFGFSRAGKSTTQGKWKNQTCTVREFIDKHFTQHVPQKDKDGLAILQGSCAGGVRANNSMETLYIIQFDVDTGQPLQVLREFFRGLGMFVIIYTTYSNGKTCTHVPRDKFMVYNGHKEPTAEKLTQFLIDEKAFNPDALQGATMGSIKRAPGEGTVIELHHPAMPKFRILSVLAEPVNLNAFKSDVEGERYWQERYISAATGLNLEYDKKCVDTSRLNYLPTCPLGAEGDAQIDIIAGDLFDLTKFTLATVDNGKTGASKRPKKAAGEKAANGKGGFIDYETGGLKEFWLGKYRDFEMETCFRTLDPAGYRGPRSNGKPCSVCLCPNKPMHTDQSQLDGHFCTNSADGSKSHCSHTTCNKMDRLDRLDLLCVNAGIKHADELMCFVRETEEDKRIYDDEAEDMANLDGAAPTPEPVKLYKTKAAAEKRIEAMARGDTAEADRIARGIAQSPELSAMDREALVVKLVKATGLTKTIFKEVMAEAAAEQKSQPGEEEEFSMSVYEQPPVAAAMTFLNSKVSKIAAGSKSKILFHPTGDAPALDIKDEEAFRSLYRNQKVLVNRQGKDPKFEEITKLWDHCPTGNVYMGGLIFEPDPAKVRPDTYNMWRGIPLQPKPGDCSLIKAHIMDNICQGVQEYYDWLWTWMAQVVQHPDAKLGSAVVMKGRKGTGKTKLFEILCRILRPYSTKVSQGAHVTGQFNAHLMAKLFITVEEAFWGGDKKAEGVFKDLISSSSIMFEKKFMDGIETSNYTRWGIISNEDWVVPATFDERRFFVLEVGEAQRKNGAYFKAIDHQMEKEGGDAAFLHELKHWVPPQEDGWDCLRDPPKTDALIYQAMQDTPPLVRFFAHVLKKEAVGIVPLGAINDRTLPGISNSEWFSAFKDFMEDDATRAEQFRPVQPHVFGKDLKRWIPGFDTWEVASGRKEKDSPARRLLPPYADMLAAFRKEYYDPLDA